jgi:hypothetical protein
VVKIHTAEPLSPISVGDYLYEARLPAALVVPHGHILQVAAKLQVISTYQDATGLISISDKRSANSSSVLSFPFQWKTEREVGCNNNGKFGEVLRRCTDWLQRLERGENVVVNLRPDEDFETEFVAFDQPRVVRVLERIAADLDTLSLVPNDPHADKESNHHDPRARHRHELAEPPPKPKKLSHREQRAALRAALGLPPQ